jgi:hypothetical protein
VTERKPHAKVVWLPVLALLMLAPTPLCADEGIELRWRFKKGQTLKYLMKHHEDFTFTLEGAERTHASRGVVT